MLIELKKYFYEEDTLKTEVIGRYHNNRDALSVMRRLVKKEKGNKYCYEARRLDSIFVDDLIGVINIGIDYREIQKIKY